MTPLLSGPDTGTGTGTASVVQLTPGDGGACGRTSPASPRGRGSPPAAARCGLAAQPEPEEK